MLHALMPRNLVRTEREIQLLHLAQHEAIEVDPRAVDALERGVQVGLAVLRAFD
jgi:hypothetical protein